MNNAFLGGHRSALEIFCTLYRNYIQPYCYHFILFPITICDIMDSMYITWKFVTWNVNRITSQDEGGFPWNDTGKESLLRVIMSCFLSPPEGWRHTNGIAWMRGQTWSLYKSLSSEPYLILQVNAAAISQQILYITIQLYIAILLTILQGNLT